MEGKHKMTKNTVIKYPLSTEKSLRLMESENKLAFIVDRKADKAEVKLAIQDLLQVSVVSVNLLINNKGKKKAYIKFSDDTPAIDIATKLGLL